MTTQKPEIMLDTKDSRGYCPDTSMIGSVWYHLGSSHNYTVIGYYWNGEDNTWMYAHTRSGSSVIYLRTPHNFHGLREDGEARYHRVG